MFLLTACLHVPSPFDGQNVYKTHFEYHHTHKVKLTDTETECVNRPLMSKINRIPPTNFKDDTEPFLSRSYFCVTERT